VRMRADGERSSDSLGAHRSGLAMGLSGRPGAVVVSGLQKGAGMKASARSLTRSLFEPAPDAVALTQATMKWGPKPAQGEQNRSDPNRCAKCGSWLVAIAPEKEPVWPYVGLERACPVCAGLICVNEVRDWWRRPEGKESA
jgi:hypothetical protein